MTVGSSPIKPGMEVIGLDGEPAGRVLEVRDFDLILQRSGRPSLVVPMIAVDHVNGDHVVLRFRAGDVDLQDWASIPTHGQEWPEMHR